MRKILLIGENGQLGKEIMDDASSFGFEIAGFEKEELDVTNESQVKEKIEKNKPDILINTSAYHFVQKCEENPVEAMKVNFLAVENLARLCREKKIIFVTYSTDYVFDGEKKVPYNEDDKPNPLQIYGISKLAGEYASLHSYPEETFIIRTCGLYGRGKGSPGKKGNFVLNIIKETEGKSIIEVSSEQIVSPTYAGDLSKATLKLLNKKAKPGIYHLVNEGYCSWYEFAKEIFTLAKIGKKIKPIDRGGVSGGVRRPKFSALKNTKAKALGIELPSRQEGLKSYFIQTNNTHSIGIMQGRLVPPKGRGIQFFPFEEWEDEFKAASRIKIDEIDFIFDLDRYQENPLWTEEGLQKIKEAIAQTRVKVRHVCADFFMRRPFFRVTEKERQENIAILKRLIESAKQIGAENIEIPLVDNSSVKTEKEKETLVKSVAECFPEAQARGITISFEADLPPRELLELVQRFDNPSLKITYDSGNSSSLGYDSYEEISTYGEYLSNVHIKDRVLHGTTVPLGEGNANFDKLFRGLKETGYKGSFTLQSARQEEGKEAATILSYVEFIQKYIQQL